MLNLLSTRANQLTGMLGEKSSNLTDPLLLLLLSWSEEMLLLASDWFSFLNSESPI